MTPDLNAPNSPGRTRPLRGFVATVLTAAIAVIVLLALEPLPIPGLTLPPQLTVIGQVLIRIVIVTSALMLIVGTANLLRVNLREIRTRRAPYAIVTIVTLITILSVYVANRSGTPGIVSTSLIFEVTQTAVESALVGMSFFLLVYAAYRLTKRRLTVWNMLFLTGTLIVLLGIHPITGLGLFSVVANWLLQVPVNAAVRGLLIGVGLGIVVVGVRTLIGADRTLRQ